MTVAIQRIADAPGAILVVDLGVSRPDNWLSPHQTALKPAEVRRIISAAVEGGWDPESPSGAFELKWQLIADRP